jgi:hypothetical protein
VMIHAAFPIVIERKQQRCSHGHMSMAALVPVIVQ